jgi:hypothetical protein
MILINFQTINLLSLLGNILIIQLIHLIKLFSGKTKTKKNSIYKVDKFLSYLINYEKEKEQKKEMIS